MFNRDRRDWLRHSFGLSSTLICMPARSRVGHDEVQVQRPLMGTEVTLRLGGKSAIELNAAVNAAFDAMSRLSDMMNHYNPSSVVSAINLSAGIAPVSVPDSLMQVLRMAQQVSVRTHGAFDITIASIRGWRFSGDHPQLPIDADIQRQLPLVGYTKLKLDLTQHSAFLTEQGMRIDLGGIAKIYILDQGLKTLKSLGVSRAMINGGGDVLAYGGDPTHPWQIGVRNPKRPQQLMGSLALTDGIIASSGDYERYFDLNGRRYHHILDPKTGYPTQGLHGVTLVSSQLQTINGLGAATMVMGLTKGRQLIESTPGLQGILIGNEGEFWRSPQLHWKSA